VVNPDARLICPNLAPEEHGNLAIVDFAASTKRSPRRFPENQAALHRLHGSG
jgi:hypothetical protein